ncbi:Benzil reductase ((S)-benzoin forming) [Balamuthia mandrillaris]
MEEAEECAVVTGGGSGIGRALAWELVRRESKYQGKVLIVGRREEALRETKRQCLLLHGEASAERLVTVAADIATEEGRALVADALPPTASLRFLVHNAGVVSPVESVHNLRLNEWRAAMAINVEAPLFLTQALLPHLQRHNKNKGGEGEGARVLMVGSGAASKAYQGWTAYCVSKAALHMLTKCLDVELASPAQTQKEEEGKEERDSVRVGWIRPGKVDTAMQEEIRGSSQQVFPMVSYFKEQKESGHLLPPERVARFMSFILCETTLQEFAEHEWDIYQDLHRVSQAE